jgi:hypothetical protein
MLWNSCFFGKGGKGGKGKKAADGDVPSVLAGTPSKRKRATWKSIEGHSSEK